MYFNPATAPYSETYLKPPLRPLAWSQSQHLFARHDCARNEKIKTAPEGRDDAGPPIAALPGPIFYLALRECRCGGSLTWSLALEWALSNKAR